MRIRNTFSASRRAVSPSPACTSVNTPSARSSGDRSFRAVRIFVEPGPPAISSLLHAADRKIPKHPLDAVVDSRDPLFERVFVLNTGDGGATPDDAFGRTVHDVDQHRPLLVDRGRSARRRS